MANLLRAIDLQPQTRITKRGEWIIPIRGRPKLGAIPDQSDVNEVAITPFDASDFLGAGVPPFEWFDDDVTLPTNLFIDKPTGIVSGTPTVPGVFPVTLTVSNKTGLSRSTFNWTITA